MDNVLIQTVDYKGRTYRDFYVQRDPGQAPGWFVFGRGANGEYGGYLISLCARPDVPLRSHPHYNCRVQRGWLTKCEAQAVADQMNNSCAAEAV